MASVCECCRLVVVGGDNFVQPFQGYTLSFCIHVGLGSVLFRVPDLKHHLCTALQLHANDRDSQKIWNLCAGMMQQQLLAY